MFIKIKRYRSLYHRILCNLDKLIFIKMKRYQSPEMKMLLSTRRCKI